MQKETLSQVKRKALRWKINALILLFTFLLFSVLVFIKQSNDSKFLDKTHTSLSTYHIKVQSLIRQRNYLDSLVKVQRKYIENHCN